ncbi:copper resistance protein CopC [Kytococcus schroeteri]|uniref:Copper resistance protein CopC n=1 Tax=Kytococcus schroeteri TaxID=138300 RepID=A0A2I1P8I4_9MICO|nr:copper resistance CopC family protein [Kytococcus schroeteri]PKZ40920.1 copper resistance protein CopC [Kytococcus schroeteri]
MRFSHTSLVRMVAGATLALCLTAAPASAHDVLEGSEPAAGETLSSAPESLDLTYSDTIQKVGAKVSVTDQDGQVVAEGAPQIDGPTASMELPGDLGEGTYTATWRVVSSDGHPISGTTEFTVGTGGGSSAAPSGSAAPTGGASEAPSSGETPTEAAPSGDTTTSPEAGATQDDGAPEEGGQDGPGTALWVGLGVAALVLVGGGLALARRR